MSGKWVAYGVSGNGNSVSGKRVNGTYCMALVIRQIRQLQRASLSVQLNIAEGYAYGNSPSFTHHLTIAYGSAVETGELLEIALDANLIAPEVGAGLLARNHRSQRLLLLRLRSLLRYLQFPLTAHRLPLTLLPFPLTAHAFGG